MEISIYFLKENKVMVGKLDISLTERAEEIFNNCLEIVSDMGGLLVYVRSTLTCSNWWKLKLFELDSLSLSHFCKNKAYMSFLEIKETIGIADAKDYLFDILEENENLFSKYLNNLKIKRINEK
jgi:hypothetical protein